MQKSPEFSLLLVDDDRLIHESLRLSLPKNWKMLGLLKAPQLPLKEMFHAAFVDMHLGTDLQHPVGPGIIRDLVMDNPKLEVIAISGDLSMDLMEQCLKVGASRFIAKPLVLDEVHSNLEKIEALWHMRQAETYSGMKVQNWIGSSTQSEELKRKVASFKGESGPILIEGETGTGKEVTFRLLNQQEPGRLHIAVNIASIPDSLFESEFFGHVKGAFTGADSQKIGLAEASHGGDLFIDEVEALPLSQQVKLLRFLETGEVRKVGSKDIFHVKSRVIFASNQNLEQLVAEGKFREDLYFRLSGKKIVLPPLRERTDDILELAQQFLKRERPRVNKSLSPEALLLLKRYRWPGNVRELKRICEQLVLTSPLPIIREQDVASLINLTPSELDQGSLQFNKGLAKLLEEFEAKVIAQCLEKENDIDKTAQTLQISRSSLYKKIKDYGIQESK